MGGITNAPSIDLKEPVVCQMVPVVDVVRYTGVFISSRIPGVSLVLLVVASLYMIYVNLEIPALPRKHQKSKNTHIYEIKY